MPFQPAGTPFPQLQHMLDSAYEFSPTQLEAQAFRAIKKLQVPTYQHFTIGHFFVVFRNSAYPCWDSFLQCLRAVHSALQLRDRKQY
uniref:Uncharacterized protein n=1 Tax=mine drainage metagenome TaxID=410659 RepID=E6QIF5_9ZZZZ